MFGISRGVAALSLAASLLTLGGSSGCSSNDSNSASGGSPDASLSDGGATLADSGAQVCDANILSLPPANQPLGDASTTTACTACVRTTCGAQTDDCNSDCTCGPLLTCAFDCVTSDAGTGALLGCATKCGGLSTLTNVPANVTALFTCVQSGCSDECGLSGLMIPGGPGTGTSTDASTDAGETVVDAGTPDTGATATADAATEAAAP